MLTFINEIGQLNLFLPTQFQRKIIICMRDIFREAGKLRRTHPVFEVNVDRPAVDL